MKVGDEKEIYFQRFLDHLSRLILQDLELARKNRGTEQRFAPYNRMLCWKMGDKDVKIFYVPFDDLRKDAQIVIVGLTPGYSSMFLSYSASLLLIENGCPKNLIARKAKNFSVFTEERRELARMLDGIGIPRALGLRKSIELLQDKQNLLHSTFATHYAAFKHSVNYVGISPDFISSMFFKNILERYLINELNTIKDALVVPLGSRVSEILLHLIRSTGTLVHEQCLLGFPNPAPCNPLRHSEYEERRFALQNKVAKWFRR